MVGRSGAATERLREETAKARSFPSRTSGAAFTTFKKAILMRPASRSGSDRGRATIGHRLDVGLGHVLEQLVGKMLRGAGAGVAVGQLAGLRLRERHQFVDALRRHVGMHHQQVRGDEDLGDRDEVLHGIERELVVQADAHDQRGVAAHEQRVAVRWRLGGAVGRDVAARAGDVLDHHRLARGCVSLSTRMRAATSGAVPAGKPTRTRTFCSG